MKPFFFNLARKVKPGKKGKGKGSGSKGSGKANVGCGTGAGGFAKGNRCRMGGAGSGEKPGGPVSHKAREDAKKEDWRQYHIKKDGYPDTSKMESKTGLPAKINVEKGPPRNKREEKALERATKAGKEAIVRTSKKSAYTETEGSQKHFYHGDFRVSTVLPTADVPKVKPPMGGKPYDPSAHERTKPSKFTVITQTLAGGEQISGHPTRAKAEKVARAYVKAERDEWAKEAEFKMVKDHRKDNLVKETELGREPRSVLTIRVLTPKTEGSQVEDLTMKTNGFNEEFCKRRNRVAALRDNVDAPSVSFVKNWKHLYKGVWQPSNLITALGDEVGDEKHSFGLLKEFLADNGSNPLKQDDVYIHWLEAANGNFIPDRFMFLDASTLRNVAARSSDGFAFMNSHRTGGLSSPAELPYGRTFAGRYEEAEKDGILHRRALVGMYMLRGTHPNGPLGMSTDDLHKGILGGTINDVSMGLVGGSRLCDVCVQELGSKDCPHVPATHKDLTEDHKKAQLARGVSGGKASYTLVDAMPQEVSAVFKGAVPGAGFRKAMSLAKTDNGFRSEYGAELLQSYGEFLDVRERLQFGPKTPKSKDAKMPKFSITDLLKSYRAAGSPDPDEIDLGILDGDPGTAVPNVETTRLAQERAELARKQAEFDAKQAEFNRQNAELRLSLFKTEAETKLGPYVEAGKLSVAERDSLTQLYVFAAVDDADRPVTGPDGKPVKRTDLLFKGLDGLKSKGSLFTEEIGDEPTVEEEEQVLPSNLQAEKPASAKRVAELLKGSSLGQQVAAELSK